MVFHMTLKLFAMVAIMALASVGASAQTDVATCDPGTIDSNGNFACDFNMPMVEATTPLIVHANFTLPGLGEYRDINMDFYRNGEKIFDMSTYGVTFVREGDHVRLKISTWDRKNRNGKFSHRVAGKLYLQPDPAPAN